MQIGVTQRTWGSVDVEVLHEPITGSVSEAHEGTVDLEPQTLPDPHLHSPPTSGTPLPPPSVPSLSWPDTSTPRPV